MENEFSTLLRRFRENLKFPDEKKSLLTLEKFGILVGLSKQYLNNLENYKLKKNLSFDKLKDVIVLLSQNEISSDQKSFTPNNDSKSVESKKGRKRSSETKSYFDINGLPEPEKLDLNKLKKLIFVSTGLTKYENSFVPVESVLSNKSEIDKFIEINQLSPENISEFKHRYEVWTLSDNLGEALFDESAESTAKYILKYKIKFLNFIQLEDNIQWKTALYKIKSAFDSLKDVSSDSIKEYWESDKVENYIHFYGISSSSFFIRLRIYDPFSPDAIGNYNVGGKTESSAKFSNILPSEIPLIVEKLKLIVFADEARQLDDGKNFLIEELGAYVNKKLK